MKGRILRTTSIWASWAAVCIAGACALPDGSETNWFNRCNTNSECKAGNQCLCGACTTTCTTTPESCNGMTCASGIDPAYTAQCGTTQPAGQGICQPPCGSDVACQKGQTCLEGKCAWTDSFMETNVMAAVPPPPISGGTLAIVAQGHIAVAADADRDQLAILNLDELSIKALVPLKKGAEPGRVVEDGAGRVHVALRRSGAVVTVQISTGAVLAHRAVCQYPRGLAYDAAADSIYVACAGGELVTLPASGGEATRRVRLDDDLRDVVVDGDHLLVSRFRSAEVLVVGADGSIQSRFFPRPFQQPRLDDGTLDETSDSDRAPAVAWRMIPSPKGGAYISLQYQRSGLAAPVKFSQGAYGGISGGINPCGAPTTSVVKGAVARVDARGTVSAVTMMAALPVDLAVREYFAPGSTITTSRTLSVAAAGNRPTIGIPRRASVLSFSDLAEPVRLDPVAPLPAPCVTPGATFDLPGQVVAVGYDWQGSLVTQSRSPWVLRYRDQSLEIPGEQPQDTGHDLFHTATVAGIACASCHPEGRDDGFVWTFDKTGARRTQSLAGGLTGTAPFHWSGDMTDLSKLMHDVMTVRMSGFSLDEQQVQAVAHFIDTIPAWQPRQGLDAAAVERGRVLFNDSNVGCATCHAGARLTDNRTIDVGTGGKFQVPSLLGVSRRAPFFHDGSVPTLAARFAVGVSGDQHGHIASLSGTQTADLVEYLNTL